ncbi:MAG TPA: glycosidase [Syntrophothermus lipocalidus]|nr:glycosidase [Syntrophothermus lipocalidus]
MPKSVTQSVLEEFAAKDMFGVQSLENVDLVVGFPLYRNSASFKHALETIDKGLSSVSQIRPLIVCSAETATYKDLVETVKQVRINTPVLTSALFANDANREDTVRTVLEIGKEIEADVLLFSSYLSCEELAKFEPEQVKQIIDPIRSEYDLVIASLRKDPCYELADNIFVTPLVETFYGYRLKNTLSGIYAISHDLVEDYCAQSTLWEDISYGYGFDPWLVTRAVCWKKQICQVELSSNPRTESLETTNNLIKDVAATIFACIKRDEEQWLNKDKLIIKTPDILGSFWPNQTCPPEFDVENMLLLFRRGFSQYKPVYRSCLPRAAYEHLENLSSFPGSRPVFPHDMWAEIVHNFLFHYWFSPPTSREDILSALAAVFAGYAASFFAHLRYFQHLMHEKTPGYHVTDVFPWDQTTVINAFYRSRPRFIEMWKKASMETNPPLVPAHYMEFVPGIPIVLPKKIPGKGGKVISTEPLFNRVQKRYVDLFNHFVHQSLGAPEDATSQEIAAYIQSFVQKVDKTMGILFPGDIYTEEGTREVVDHLFKLLPHPKMFSISTRLFREALLRFPPRNLLIPASCQSSRELLNRIDARDAVTLANLLETRNFTDMSLLWILDNLKPDDMEEVEIRPIVVGPGTLDGKLRLGSFSDFNKLTTRIVVRPLIRGMGGDYPRLRFCLSIARYMVMAENYSVLWQLYAKERKNLGEKIKNSLVSRYETGAFTANNLFENFHHRALVRHFRSLAQRLAENGRYEEAQVLRLMTDSYGLSQVLDDGTFIPCSAWSWSSYSYKGGRGIPTPMSNHVEEKWFNHDLLEEIYAELGYHSDEIWQGMVQLIGEGKADNNILDAHLGIRPKDVVVVAQDTPVFPPAQPLVRYPDNPILEPIADHPWESKYVLNAAALRIGSRVYVLYRAFGEDEVSRIGLAITDGYNVLERLPDPIFSPQDSKENKGCEDPRVVIIDDRIFMLYTAYDGVIAQIAAAFIQVGDFLNRRFDRWQRLGLAFEDIWDKDAILFPEKINGKYVIYHRIEPSVWVSYLDKLEFPIPKDRHSIILGPRSGRMWDSLKIGAGTQPLKTKFGWLMIYHGVDPKRVYRLGVLLVDLRNPERLLYRSPNPILSPETGYEMGTVGNCWVPNVVFTCGAVPETDKEVLDENDRILVYYGAADTYVCVATATVGDLIPKLIRERVLADEKLELAFMPEYYSRLWLRVPDLRYDHH